ncbi:MAG: glycine cleavage system protein GcvH [Microbacterium sp.]
MTDLNDLKYTREHEWVRIDSSTGGAIVVTVGITDYAAEQLGDVVFVDLPADNAEVTAGQVMGEIESTKSVSELYSPVDGTVIDLNGEVDSDPSLVNSSPFEGGWLVQIELTGPLPELLDRAAYLELTGGEA